MGVGRKHTAGNIYGQEKKGKKKQLTFIFISYRICSCSSFYNLSGICVCLPYISFVGQRTLRATRNYNAPRVIRSFSLSFVSSPDVFRTEIYDGGGGGGGGEGTISSLVRTAARVRLENKTKISS